MPKEKFYAADTVVGGSEHLAVAWGVNDVPQVLINGVQYDRSGLNRLIGTLRRARDQVYGSDE
jgi:hypothetical protein